MFTYETEKTNFEKDRTIVFATFTDGIDTYDGISLIFSSDAGGAEIRAALAAKAIEYDNRKAQMEENNRQLQEDLLAELNQA